MNYLEKIEYELEERVCEMFIDGIKYLRENDSVRAVRLFATCRKIYSYLENSKMILLSGRLIESIEMDEEEKIIWQAIGKQRGSFLLNLTLRGEEYLREINHEY